MTFEALMAAQYMGQQMNVEMDQKKAETELRKQQAAAAEMSALMQKQQQAQNASLSNYLRSAQENQASVDALPQDRAAMYSKAADWAAKNGSPENAEKMMLLANKADDEAKKSTALVRARELGFKEDYSAAANELLRLPPGIAPTMEQLAGFTEKAGAAGVDVSKLPPPNTPEFKAHLQTAITAAMTSKDKNSYYRLLDDEARQEKRLKETADQAVLDRAEARRTSAVSKAESLQIRKEGLQIQRDLADSTISFRDAQAKKAEAGGPIRQRYVTSTTAYGEELLRNMKNVQAFGAVDTTGPFAHMQNKGTVLSSLANNATNRVTPGANQQLESALQGMALEAGQLATNLGGRGVNNALIAEFQKMIEPRKGDTNGTIMYRFANLAEFAKKRLELLAPDEGSPTEQSRRKAALTYLENIPSPAELTALYRAKKIPGAETHLKEAGTVAEKMKKLSEIARKSDAEAEAKAAIPQRQRDLLNIH